MYTSRLFRYIRMHRCISGNIHHTIRVCWVIGKVGKFQANIHSSTYSAVTSTPKVTDQQPRNLTEQRCGIAVILSTLLHNGERTL